MAIEAQDDCPIIVRTARVLAGAAGLSWDGFQIYPGYYRTMWRENAMRVLGLDERRVSCGGCSPICSTPEHLPIVRLTH